MCNITIWQIYTDQINGINFNNGSAVPLEPDNKAVVPLCHKRRRSLKDHHKECMWVWRMQNQQGKASSRKWPIRSHTWYHLKQCKLTRINLVHHHHGDHMPQDYYTPYHDIYPSHGTASQQEATAEQTLCLRKEKEKEKKKETSCLKIEWRKSERKTWNANHFFSTRLRKGRVLNRSWRLLKKYCLTRYAALSVSCQNCKHNQTSNNQPPTKSNSTWKYLKDEAFLDQLNQLLKAYQ